jgi:hypothetical protein
VCACVRVLGGGGYGVWGMGVGRTGGGGGEWFGKGSRERERATLMRRIRKLAMKKLERGIGERLTAGRREGGAARRVSEKTGGSRGRSRTTVDPLFRRESRVGDRPR